MTKRINILKLALVSAILIFFSGGCSTYHEVTKTSHYTDKISTFLKTEDGKHIIFVGRDHHYILRTDPTLAKLLGGPFQAYISLEKSNFHISSLRGVEGTVDIKLSPRAPSEIRAKSKIYGFKSGRVSVKLVGDRYDNGELDFTHFEKFSYPLAINFDVEKSFSEKASKALTTPLKAAAEGVYILLAVPVIAIICLGEERCFKH
ncbi:MULTISPECIES: hypothetical protein [Pseudoalteromonas]|uniref:hypothetical protein n=1 Tax=Pseudoalteromonas TaxID=53246 RepID=UPI000FFE36B6|nr:MULTISPECIES: hypothetical protein [Pseudoalteromonas]MCG9760803.1 hypothetical protein [Pseudoalteromonas sp. Isolate6]NKC18776.1 hypothetical protein [Pseudoalteromonas galatheae]RXE87893.1 hypothetical protein DRB05_05540 [Pseudoalteromonas sp. A757]